MFRRRRQINLDTLELPPPEPGGGLNFPAKFQVWGGNESARMLDCDFVLASFSIDHNPSVARQTNPGLIAMAHPALDPTNPVWQNRQGTAWTYGYITLVGSKNDTYSPNPQGTIRGVTSADLGCFDNWLGGQQNIALWKSDTAAWEAQMIFYAFKAGQFASRGYNGVWSDNLYTSDTVAAGWAYGACGNTFSGADWDAGIVTICDYVRAQSGLSLMMGGNGVYRATRSTLRAATDASLRENLWHYQGQGNLVDQGVDTIWNDIQQVMGWMSVPSKAGNAKVLGINAVMPNTSEYVAMSKYCLGLACVYGASYNSYDGNHTNTFWPAETYRNGQRGYLGKPVAPPTRNGNVLARQFEHGSVSTDWGSKSATFTYTG